MQRIHTVCAEGIDILGGELLMADQRTHEDRKDSRRRHRHRRRRSRGRDRSGTEAPRDEFEQFAPEERAYRTAERLAERKVKLTGEALRFGFIALLLLIFIPIAGVIVLCVWGPRLIRNFYRLVVEPKLRQRFIEEEVEKQVQATLSEERKEMEGEHARSMEQLSASIAHEIRNPITAAKSLVQQMEEDPNAEENVEYARVALDELRRVERSVSHLLRFARDEEMVLDEIQLTDIVDSAVETFRDRVSRAGIALVQNTDSDGKMRGDAEKLRRVVINLVGNAIDALVESRTVDPRVDVEIGENLAGSEVWLRIRDNGPGIGTEALQKLFSPFYTSKTNGTGLGLAISRKLVDAHAGSIEVESEPGRGAEFILSFPKNLREEGSTS